MGSYGVKMSYPASMAQIGKPDLRYLMFLEVIAFYYARRIRIFDRVLGLGPRIRATRLRENWTVHSHLSCKSAQASVKRSRVLISQSYPIFKMHFDQRAHPG